MVTVAPAGSEHVQSIISVCTKGYWFTYKETHSEGYITRVVKEFYNEERVQKEVEQTSKEWGGYFVALDGHEVVGACGGGLIDKEKGEVFVLYIDPVRRNEGIGSSLLEALTEQQLRFGAKEQWVSVQKKMIRGSLSIKHGGSKSKVFVRDMAIQPMIHIFRFVLSGPSYKLCL